MHLLDTNIVSAMVRDPRGIVYARLRQVGVENAATSVIVAAELRFGVEKRRSSRLADQLEQVLDTLAVLPLEIGADAHYAKIRARLEARGTPIGANDMWIAAHALSLGAVVVTDNVREFERVEGLVVENWLRA